MRADGAGTHPAGPAAIVYLHGFRSSPASFKSCRMASALDALELGDRFHAPTLPPSPSLALRLAIAVCQVALDGADPATELVIVGSSLGGLYATAAAERLGCRAVLINPAVDVGRDLSPLVGTHTLFHDPSQSFDFLPSYVDELRAIAPATITRPERYFLIAATGDEVLDWRDADRLYAGARKTIVQGGDHGLSDFDRHLPAILDFCGIDAGRPAAG
ncbi:YqiA/YcfP family alpha/beta fold hydrolase [Derxia gummosa]|uniref:YqiA/YcfP family alpha/beta fold hydrolase n=1 Tax=Derxia gummosa DSM 723 TaxID=1121388 RepID=A0A8B6X932_9BURK|nr:YqiA/YcfP family alpha/beta fold hydrolase [Derxia gummosa]